MMKKKKKTTKIIKLDIKFSNPNLIFLNNTMPNNYFIQILPTENKLFKIGIFFTYFKNIIRNMNR
jgi:hypothetical protein